jgi:hypothetical protein
MRFVKIALICGEQEYINRNIKEKHKTEHKKVHIKIEI